MTMNIPIDKLICGDAASVLKSFPDNSINLIITSPPYFRQREYAGGEIGAEHNVERYLDAILEVFHECVRIIKEDGSIVFNIGDKYQNESLLLIPYSFALRAIEKENIMLVNNITWVKSNPTPRQFDRRLVSSTEPFFHFVKTKKYYYDASSWNEADKDIKQAKLNSEQTNVGKRYRTLIANSNLSEQEKENANRSLDDAIKEIHNGNISGFRMKIRGIHSPAFGGQSGGRASQMKKYGFTIIKMYGNKIKRDVIISPVESLKGYHHPAVYPEKIIEKFIGLLTKQGDVVLDPFIGSGTTAIAAKLLHRHFVGIDINPAYITIIEQRLRDLKLI